MNDIKIAFRKNDNRLFSKIIKLWTKGPYSHVAIVIEGKEYSASFKKGGVYSVHHTEDHNKWDYITIKANVLNILNFYAKTRYDRYDLLGLLGFLIPFKDRSSEWFCSEWVANALKISGCKLLWTKEPSKINPNKLYQILA